MLDWEIFTALCHQLDLYRFAINRPNLKQEAVKNNTGHQAGKGRISRKYQKAGD